MKSPSKATPKETPKKGAAALAPRPTPVRPQPPAKPVEVPVATPGQRIREAVDGIDSIEDAFRQTGRTTRMLEAAAFHAKAFGPALIIMKDEARVDHVLNCTMFYPSTQVQVRSHNPKLPLFDWNTVEPLPDNPQYAGWRVFVDHDVVLSYHRHLFGLLGWQTCQASNVD